jgi:hypothetical protein
MPPKVHSGVVTLHPKPHMTQVALKRVDVSLGLTIGGPVVPGQPIPAEWFFANLSGRLDLGTGYKVRILFEDTGIYSSDDDPQLDPRRLAGSDFLAIGSLASFEAAHERVLVPAASCNSALGQSLYTFGQRALRLEVTTNGRDRGPYVATDTLTVVPEAVHMWWTWPAQPDSTPGLAVPLYRWKQYYNIIGDFTNHSPHVRMHLEAVLKEQEEMSGPIKRRSYPAHDIDAGGSKTVSLPLPNPIAQDWKWFDQKFSYPSAGPTSKTFYYTAELTMRDCYGNPFSAVSSDLAVVVQVSADKVNLGAGAFAAQISAWVLAALSKVPVIGWIFGIGATAAGATALALGSAALDPPEPNSRYLERVEVEDDTVPAALLTEESFRPLGEFLGHVEYVANALVALSEIESRLQGARIAKSKRGTRAQALRYREVLSDVLDRISRLPQLTEESVRSLESMEELRPQAVERLFKAPGGRRSPPIVAAMRGNVSPAHVKQAADLLQQRQTQKLVSGGIGPPLRLMSVSVISAVATVEREAGRVLAEA